MYEQNTYTYITKLYHFKTKYILLQCFVFVLVGNMKYVVHIIRTVILSGCLCSTVCFYRGFSHCTYMTENISTIEIVMIHKNSQKLGFKKIMKIL